MLELAEKLLRIKKAKALQKDTEELLKKWLIALMAGLFYTDEAGNSREEERIEEVRNVLRKHSDTSDEMTERHIDESAKEIYRSTNKRLISQAEKEINKVSNNSPVMAFIENEYLTGYVSYDDEAIRQKLKAKILSNVGNYPEWVVAILLGLAFTDVPDHIKTVFDKARSTLIAENEVNWIRNYKNHLEKREAGNATHTWLSMQNEKVRLFHLEADGQTVPIDEPFEVGGELLMFPGDTSLGASLQNVIRCRCIEI